VQGEGRRTCGELRLVGHRSNEYYLEKRGRGTKMGMRDADVTDAQAVSTTSSQREDCW